MSRPPKLNNDCFALPAGVHWTPVSEALGLLEQRLQCCVPVETCAVEASDGRVLAHAVVAARSHPPCPNSAVDGYAFSGGLEAGAQSFELRQGRSAAGEAFQVSSGPVKHCEFSRAQLCPRVPIRWSCKKTLR